MGMGCGEACWWVGCLIFSFGGFVMFRVEVLGFGFESRLFIVFRERCDSLLIELSGDEMKARLFGSEAEAVSVGVLFCRGGHFFRVERVVV